jgi:hypothetical protein
VAKAKDPHSLTENPFSEALGETRKKGGRATRTKEAFPFGANAPKRRGGGGGGGRRGKPAGGGS